MSIFEILDGHLEEISEPEVYEDLKEKKGITSGKNLRRKLFKSLRW